MKIYAVYDRKIEYFMQPFAAPDAKAVLSGIAREVNTKDSTIAQAPYDFEIWELGVMDENGYINPNKTLIANCAMLVRKEP